MTVAALGSRDIEQVDAWRLAFPKARYVGSNGTELLRPLIEREFSGCIAVVASTGTESTVLLDPVAAIVPRVPVIGT